MMQSAYLIAPARWAIAAALAAMATAAGAAIHDPCLGAHSDIESYVRAFQEEGWAEPADAAARLNALRSANETWLFLQIPRAIHTEENYLAYLKSAHQGAPQDLSIARILARDDAAAAILFNRSGTQVRVICIISAQDLPEVDTALVGAMPVDNQYLYGTLSAHVGSVEDGVIRRVDWNRFEGPPHPPAGALGRESVVVNISFGWKP